MNIKKIAYNIFCISLSLLCILSVNVFAESKETVCENECWGMTAVTSAKGSVSYYGRDALGKLENASALLSAYDRIVAGVAASDETILVYDGVNPITPEEIKTVYDAYRRDYVGHFWLGNYYSIEYDSTTVISLSPEYVMFGEALDNAKVKFDSAVSDMLDGVNFEMSEYDREKLIHDRLAAKVSYVDSPNAHNAYGAIVEGKAVCEGYAEAYQYLLQLAGLQSFIATGTGLNSSTGLWEAHAWNIVRVDGFFYHVDLTWDDQETLLFYAYFNRTDAEISEDHMVEATDYALPVCDSVAADYFTLNDGRMSGFNAEAIGLQLRNNGLIARVYVTGDKTEFVEDFRNNILSVMEYANVTGGFTYGYAVLGREYVITVGESGYTVSGIVTGMVDDSDAVTIQLWRTGEKAPDYEVVICGRSSYYSIENVKPGTYVMMILKDGSTCNECEITVKADAIVKNVNLGVELVTDLNGDGTFNSKDIIRLMKYISANGNGVEVFGSTDINGDGYTNVKDIVRLMKYLAGAE